MKSGDEKTQKLDARQAQASLPEQYQRMLNVWDQRTQSYANCRLNVSTESLAGLPAKRWARDEHIRRVMTERFGERYVEYRRLFELAKLKRIVPEFPIHIDFDLMDYCNLACQNCTENFRDWSRKTLDLDWVKHDPFFAKRRLFAANVGNAAEPFLRPAAALELIRFLREHDIIDIFIHTNGLLIKPEIIEQLIDHEVTWVSFSVDAFSDETFRITRGRRLPQADSGYAQVVETIHRLIERRNARGRALPFVRLSYLVVPENYHEVKAFSDYWMPHVEMIEYQDYAAPHPVGSERESYVMLSGLFEQMSDFECGMPFYRMGVSASGAVAPCCSSYGHLDELRLGDIAATDSIEEMWRSRKLAMIREEHSRGERPLRLKACEHCLRENYHFKYYAPSADA